MRKYALDDEKSMVHIPRAHKRTVIRKDPNGYGLVYFVLKSKEAAKMVVENQKSAYPVWYLFSIENVAKLLDETMDDIMNAIQLDKKRKGQSPHKFTSKQHYILTA